jgi:hypothetical protein
VRWSVTLRWRREFQLALDGRYTDHLRRLLRQLPEDLDSLDRQVALVDLRIGQMAAPHKETGTCAAS